MAEYGAKAAEEAEEDLGTIRGMIGGAEEQKKYSLACILLRRVLLISTNGSMDRSVERSNFNYLRSQVMSIPNCKYWFGIRSAQRS